MALEYMAQLWLTQPMSVHLGTVHHTTFAAYPLVLKNGLLEHFPVKMEVYGWENPVQMVLMGGNPLFILGFPSYR